MKKFTKILALCLVTVFTALALVACAPNSNPEKAEANLKDNGYIVIRLSETAAKIALGEGAVAIVSGTKINEDKSIDTVIIIYFEDASSAQSLWEKAEEYIKNKNKESSDDEIVVERSGKMIYGGTKAGIKATN